MAKARKRIVRLAMVDDHPIVRNAIARTIEEDLPYVRVVVQAANGQEFMEALKGRTDIDIALVDLGMPVMDGFEVLEQLDKEHPEIRSLVLTFDASEDALKRTVRAGARGHLLKGFGPEELNTAIEQVLDHGWYVTGTAMEALKKCDLRTIMEKERDAAMQRISPMEQKVIELTCSEKNLPSKLVAVELDIEPSSVETYLKRIYEKLCINGKIPLLRLMIKWGVVKL